MTASAGTRGLLGLPLSLGWGQGALISEWAGTSDTGPELGGKGSRGWVAYATSCRAVCGCAAETRALCASGRAEVDALCPSNAEVYARFAARRQASSELEVGNTRVPSASAHTGPGHTPSLRRCRIASGLVAVGAAPAAPPPAAPPTLPPVPPAPDPPPCPAAPPCPAPPVVGSSARLPHL